MRINFFARFFLITFIGFITIFSASAQDISVRYDLKSMHEKNQLEVFNRTVSTFSDHDKTGIRFSKNENDGVAWLKHVIFSNGTIELDIRGKDAMQQSFVGIAFHGTDDKTMDVVYFRPFNFQAADPGRKSHAVQYVSHPEHTWQVLREKFNGVYEKPVNPSPDGNAWFHVRVVVNSPLINVYVNGSKEPSLTVEKLNNRASGRIGLWVGNTSDGDFANLMISSQTE
jgi:hypothetical protein